MSQWDERIEWYQNGVEPLLHPLVHYEGQSEGRANFMWSYGRSQGLYVVKPQPPELRLVSDNG